MKISRYTYTLDTKSGEIILYNGRIGFESICKINKKLFQNITNKHCNLNDSIIDQLKKKGHLIEENIDERAAMNELYATFMNNDTLHLIILPTEKCNFKCVYCYEQFNNGKMSEKNMIQLVDFVKKQIKGKRCLSVEWFGGEPLLEIDFIEELSAKFLEICKKQKKKYFASITSNGYLLDLNTFDRLYKARVMNYQITVDGIANKHDKQRPLSNGNPTFHTIVNNLKQISTERKHARISVMLRTNCMMKNNARHELENYLHFINQTFGEDKRFYLLLRPVMDWGGNRINDIKSRLLDFQEFGNLLERNAKYINTKVYRWLLSPGGQVCYAAKRNQYTIGSDGSIYKCTCDFENKEVTKIGTLDQGISEYRYFQWLLDITQSSDKCMECYYFPICMGDYCPHNRICAQEDTQCPIEYLIMDSILKVLDERQEIELLSNENI